MAIGGPASMGFVRPGSAMMMTTAAGGGTVTAQHPHMMALPATGIHGGIHGVSAASAGAAGGIPVITTTAGIHHMAGAAQQQTVSLAAHTGPNVA